MADNFETEVIPQRQSEIDALAAKASGRETALAGEMQTSAQQRDQTLRPMEDQLSAAMAQQPQAPAATPLPQVKPKPPVDPKEYQQFSMGLIAMAMIGGVASRGNWLGVSSTLNGALKGFIEGNQARAEKDYKDYQQQFDSARAHDQQAQAEFERILQNRNLSINSMLSQIKIAAARYDRQDIRFAAEQKSIDAIWKQVDASRNSLAQMEERHDRMSAQIAAAMERAKLTGAGARPQLTDQGRAFVEQSLLLGDKSVVQMVSSRFGAAQTIPIVNDLAQKGVDPGDMVAAKKALDAYGSTLRQTEQRKAGVERLTGAVQRMEKNVLELAQKVVPTGTPLANVPLNRLQQYVGSEQYAKFRTEVAAIARQYIEAVTMPGSNAQLHASSQELADSIINPNMSVGQLVGTFQGMNEEIQAGSQALSDTSRRLHEAISRGWTKANEGPVQFAQPPEKESGSGSATNSPAPYSDPAKEQRYQEWKKAHGQS